MNPWDYIAPAVTSAVTLAVAWFGFRSKRLEDRDKAAADEREAAKQERDAIRAEIARLREDLDDRDREARDNHKSILSLRLEVSQLQIGVLTLLAQLHSAGLTPHWQPPSEWMPFTDIMKQQNTPPTLPNG